MDNRLFFVSDGSAVEMREQAYETEDRLQKIVEDNPHLLARAWSENPCRLFPVQREFEIAESGDSANAYWLDHLFIAEDAVPVLVEVKRSSDTRIRREVVGQMLDYACRAAAWSAEELRVLFKERNSEDDIGELDTDEFWGQVATNLKAERLRLVFVADRIPDTLRVLIEFLDRNMEGVEVYGVEVKRYSANDAVLLTSSIVGNSLPQPKPSPCKRLWDEESFREALRERGLSELAPVVADIRRRAASLGMNCPYEKTVLPSFTVRAGGQYLCLVSVWWKKSTGYLCTAEFYIPHLLSDCLDGSWTEASLRSLLTNIPGKSGAYGGNLIWDTKYHLYMDLRALSSENDLERFGENLKALCEAIQSSQRTDVLPSSSHPDTGN